MSKDRAGILDWVGCKEKNILSILLGEGFALGTLDSTGDSILQFLNFT